MKDQFYDALERELLTTDNSLVGGDFNGHIGEDNSSCESVHGGFGYGSQNSDGVRLLDCAMSARLFFAITALKKLHTQFVTFMSGRIATQIDYIFYRKGSISSLKNAKTIPVGIQHKLVVAHFTMKKVHKQRKVKRQPRIKTWKLRDPETKKLFTTEFAATPETTTWEELKNNLFEVAQNVYGVSRGHAASRETWWWNQEVEEAVRMKKQLFKQWRRNKNDANRTEYANVKRAAKHTIICDAINSQVEQAIAEADSMKIFNIAKQRVKQRQDVVGTNCLKDAEEKLQTNIAARKKIWKDHMYDIMNVEHSYTSSDKPAVEGPSEEVTVAELKSALRALANKKAPGPSGITAKVLKAAGDPFIDVLTTICSQI